MAAQASHIKRIAEHLEKPELDNRTYRVIQLPNELEILLIHDDVADQASASLSMGIGSFSNPSDMLGMAHAIEHLLFLGTKKFPVESEYSEYLAKHGGYSNAYTASTQTMYYFQLNATSSDTDADTSQTSPLYEALDRFSQFFIEPLFLEDCLVRELKAVDSEHKKNLQSDVWRAQQLDRTLSNHAHPRRLFSTGSYKTLHDDPIARGVSIRESFIKFYQQHYSANNMKLVVLGRESLDQLQEWCSTLFAPVVNRQFPRPHWTMAPYGKDECMTQVFTKTIKDEKSLVLKFSIPDQTELWQYRPDSYISGLIGDEGPGSILAVLKSHGWATSLSAGASGATADEPTFGIHVSLTPEGFKEYRGVTKLVFQYIAILSSQAPEEWRHDETRKLREIDFKFSEKQRADQTTSTLAAVMHEPYQRECLLSAGSVATKFNAQYVKDILACLHPSQLRLVLSAQQLPVEPDKTEEWYGTEYRYEPIPKDYIQELTRSFDDSIAGKRPSELQLPKRNEFIPDNLSVEKHKVDKPALAPTLLRSDDSVRIWWKKDDTFWAPKADLHIKLRSVLVGASALTVTLAMLFQMLVEDSLQEHAYAAEIAGLEYAVSATTDGFSIQLAGYNDKLAVLLERVLVAIRDLTFTDNRFEVIKDRISRSLANAEYQEPYRQIMTRLNWLITERTYLHHEQLAELSRIGPDDVRHASREMLKQLHIEVFAFGNLQRKEALHCSELVENILKPRSLPTTQWRVRRQIMLATGKQYEFASTLKDPANINHCLVYSVNCGPHTDLETRNKALLFDTMTSTSCFETLRTKEQLGYVVHSTARLFTTEWSFFILVQSERDPVYLESRVVAWLDGLEKYLDEMSDAQFESFRGGLVKSRLQKLKNMAEESARLWARVSRESYEFDRESIDAEAIQKLTKKDVVDFYHRYVKSGSKDKTTLVVQLFAQNSTDAKKEGIADGSDVVSGEKVAQISLDENAGHSGTGTGHSDDKTSERKIVIDDVRAFRASLPVGPGVKAARPLSDFAENGPKL